MQVYIGSDQAALEGKNHLKTYLQTKENVKMVDLGVFEGDTIDYVDITREVCEKILENEGSFGIILTAQGIEIPFLANRREGIRAILPANENLTEIARKEHNANLLCLGVAWQDEKMIQKLVDVFLATSFAGTKALSQGAHLTPAEQMLKGRQEATEE